MPAQPAQASTSAPSDNSQLPTVDYGGFKWDYVSLDPGSEDEAANAKPAAAPKPTAVHQRRPRTRRKAPVRKSRPSSSAATATRPSALSGQQRPSPATTPSSRSNSSRPTAPRHRSPQPWGSPSPSTACPARTSGSAPRAWTTRSSPTWRSSWSPGSRRRPGSPGSGPCSWCGWTGSRSSYCDYILDLFGDGEGPPRRLYNRAAFEKWWARYVGEMREIGRDDWKKVPTPYEV
jgi:hypothetical protein